MASVLEPPPIQAATIPPLVRDAVANLSPQDVKSVPFTGKITGAYELVSVTSDPMVTSTQTFSFSTSLYYASIIRVAETLGDTDYPYRMSLSTDHDTSVGGIWMLKAPSLTGPWINPNTGNAQRGAAFVDLVTGRGPSNNGQTETAQYVWEPLSRLYYVYYQQQIAANVQQTCLAVTPDLINYEVVGPVLLQPGPLWPGAYKQHTGYAYVVRRADGDWISSHLCGAGNYTRYSTSYSRDGVNWYTDPVQKTGAMSRQGDDDKRVFPNANVFKVNGELWGITSRSNFVSGANSGAPLVVAGPLSPDMNSWIRPPEPIWQPKYAWEAGGSAGRYFIDADGQMYSPVSNGFKIGLAKANFRAEGLIS